MLGFLKAFKNTSKDVENIKIDGWLDKSQVYGIYLLTDSKVCRVAKYFQEHGLPILSASSNISKIGGKFIMDIEPSILLLIDTGRGAYSNSKAQRELIDIIGAGDLSMNKAVIVFYTDSNMKIEALNSLTNQGSIKWLKYNGSRDVLLKMLSAKIKLEKSNNTYDDTYKGIKCELEDSGFDEHTALNTTKLMNIISINESIEKAIFSNELTEDELVKGFQVKI